MINTANVEAWPDMTDPPVKNTRDVSIIFFGSRRSYNLPNIRRVQACTRNPEDAIQLMFTSASNFAATDSSQYKSLMHDGWTH